MKYLLPLFFIKFLVHTTDPSLVVPGNYYIKMCIATLTENKWTDPEYGRRKGLVFSDCGWLQYWLGQVSRWYFKKSLPEGTSKKWLMGKQEKL